AERGRLPLRAHHVLLGEPDSWAACRVRRGLHSLLVGALYLPGTTAHDEQPPVPLGRRGSGSGARCSAWPGPAPALLAGFVGRMRVGLVAQRAGCFASSCCGCAGVPSPGPARHPAADGGLVCLPGGGGRFGLPVVRDTGREGSGFRRLLLLETQPPSLRHPI